jgi:hypothetical protein
MAILALLCCIVAVAYASTRRPWDKREERKPTLSPPDDGVITNLDADRLRRARRLSP